MSRIPKYNRQYKLGFIGKGFLFPFVFTLFLCRTASAQNIITIPALDPGDSICIVYDVKVNNPFPLGVGQIQCQDTLTTASPMGEIPTSDPDSLPDMFKPTGTLVCNPVAGNLSVMITTICKGDSIPVTITGNQTAPEYTQAFLVVDPVTKDVISIQYDANVNFDQAGDFKVYSYNYLTGSTVNTSPANLSDIDCDATGACCDTSMGMFLISVNQVTPGTLSEDQTICSGDIPASVTGTSATGQGTISYQWQMSTTGCMGTWSNLVDSVGLSISPTALTVSTSYRRIDKSTLNGVECLDTTNCITITVNDVDAGTIGEDQIICEDDVPAPLMDVVAATFSGTVSYQWQDSPTGSEGSFMDITGATSATFSPPALNDTMYYRRVVTSTLNLVECSDTTNIVAIYINYVTAGTITMDQVVCEGSAPEAIIELTGAIASGAISYQWQISTDGCSGTFVDVSMANDKNYQPPSITVDTWYRRIDISTVETSVCRDTTNCIAITVNTISAGVISGDATICYGSAPGILSSDADATGTATPSYQWQSGITGCMGVFTDIPGATMSTYDAGPLMQSTTFRRIATSTVGILECSDTTNCVEITVRSVLIDTVIQQCIDPDLYDLKICLMVMNPGPSGMFNLVVDGMNYGPINYSSLDMNGCYVLSNASFDPTDFETFDVTVADVDVLMCGDSYEFTEKVCFECPVIGGVVVPTQTCQASSFNLTATGLDKMAQLSNSETDFGIEFVAFSGGLPADPYSGGNSLGVVPFSSLSMSGTVANLTGVSGASLGIAGTYTICAILTPAPMLDPDCRPFQSGSLILEATPILGGIISGPAVVCPDLEDLPYAILPASNATSYDWSFSNGTGTISGNGFPSIEMDFMGSFTPGTLSVTAANGCGVSSPLMLNISKGSDAFCSFASCLSEEQNISVDNTLLNMLGSPDVYQAINQLQSNATIEAMRTIIFRAGNEILLNPPFTVELGATFEAEIKACILTIQGN
ncbi:MAG: hypothetical protein KDC80_23285 [Saprospiraceae bacterium]|nr:hypothetical protein [Saprospiraceae bacterium]